MTKIQQQFFISGLFVIATLVSGCGAKNLPATQNQQILADMVSPDEIADEMGLAGQSDFMVAPPQDARVKIFVDKSNRGMTETSQLMRVYVDNQLVREWQVSTGRERWETSASGKKYFSRTPKGTFAIYKRVKNYWSNTWKAPMPFAQFIVGGIAMHATSLDHYKDLGSRASGGCIRLRLENAEELWNLVSEIGVPLTTVTVFE